MTVKKGLKDSQHKNLIKFEERILGPLSKEEPTGRLPTYANCKKSQPSKKKGLIHYFKERKSEDTPVIKKLKSSGF